MTELRKRVCIEIERLPQRHPPPYGGGYGEWKAPLRGAQRLPEAGEPRKKRQIS